MACLLLATHAPRAGAGKQSPASQCRPPAAGTATPTRQPAPPSAGHPTAQHSTAQHGTARHSTARPSTAARQPALPHLPQEHSLRLEQGVQLAADGRLAALLQLCGGGAAAGAQHEEQEELLGAATCSNHSICKREQLINTTHFLLSCSSTGVRQQQVTGHGAAHDWTSRQPHTGEAASNELEWSHPVRLPPLRSPAEGYSSPLRSPASAVSRSRL